MIIATWNLDHGGPSKAARLAQEAVLRDLGADVAVLTEPPAAYKTGPGVVVSPPLCPTEGGLTSWVAVVGPSVEPVALDVPYGRVAAAARVTVGGESVVVCGTVLPWRGIRRAAPDLVRDGESFADVFARVLAEQVADIKKLQAAGERVVWAGDFNQSLAGLNDGGSNAGRDALIEALDELGLTAWNGQADHAEPPRRAIDLICGPKAWNVARQGRIDPVREGVRMSDHAGYWVEV